MTEPDGVSKLRSHFRERRRGLDEHPAPEALVAYRAGTLEPAAAGEVRAHLVACEECADLFIDLAALEASHGPSVEASEIEIEAAWRQQRKRLFPGRQRLMVQFGGWAAAACLAVVAGALAFELRQQNRRAAGFYDPDLPRVIVEEQSVRGLEEAHPVLELEPGKPGLVLLLLRPDLPFSSFRAEVFLPDDRPVLVREGLSSSEDLLLIPVTAELLPAGRVRVVVSGLEEERYERIADYALQVHHR